MVETVCPAPVLKYDPASMTHTSWNLGWPKPLTAQVPVRLQPRNDNSEAKEAYRKIKVEMASKYTYFD